MIAPMHTQRGASPEETETKPECPQVCFVAPGAGLGHLVRVSALAMELRKLGVPSRILTHSLHAPMVAAATGCAIEFFPASRWTRAIPEAVARAQPRLVVLDTFPWGIRGEWAGVGSLPFRSVLLARRLHVSAYLNACRLSWNAESPLLRHVIVCEPLNRAYQDILENSGSELHPLPGRIRLPWEDGSFSVSGELVRTLEAKRTWLVVHSGPPEETEKLVRLAQTEAGGIRDAQVVVVAPGLRGVGDWRTCRFFPAALLIPHVHRLVTGAGYNCIAEATPFRAIHRGLAFPRRYDDQKARLEEFSGGAFLQLKNGAPVAARRIASFL